MSDAPTLDAPPCFLVSSGGVFWANPAFKDWCAAQLPPRGGAKAFDVLTRNNGHLFNNTRDCTDPLPVVLTMVEVGPAPPSHCAAASETPRLLPPCPLPSPSHNAHTDGSRFAVCVAVPPLSPWRAGRGGRPIS